MKCIFTLSLIIPAAIGQTGTASIAGTVLDAKTQKPIPAALVMAVRSGPPPLSRNTKSGGDGAFQIQGLTAGRYSLCVQAPGDGYLDPCQWNGSPTTITLVSGQAAAEVSLRLTPASVLTIQVKDAQKILSQLTKDGRRLEVKIPAGAKTGTRVRVRGEGYAGAQGGPTGDLYLVVKVTNDPRFERRGDDLHVKVPVDLYTAVLGGEAVVPTLTGDVHLKVPAGAQNGQVFRLRGKGVPKLKSSGEYGDLYAQLDVRLPANLTAKQRALFEELRRTQS